MSYLLHLTLSCKCKVEGFPNFAHAYEAEHALSIILVGFIFSDHKVDIKEPSFLLVAILILY